MELEFQTPRRAVAITHEAAVRDVSSGRINRRDRMAGGERDELLSPIEEKRIAAHDQRANAALYEPPERGIDLGFAAGIEDVKLAAEVARRLLKIRRLRRGFFGIVRIEEQSNN